MSRQPGFSPVQQFRTFARRRTPEPLPDFSLADDVPRRTVPEVNSHAVRLNVFFQSSIRKIREEAFVLPVFHAAPRGYETIWHAFRQHEYLERLDREFDNSRSQFLLRMAKQMTTSTLIHNLPKTLRSYDANRYDRRLFAQLHPLF